MESLRSWTSLGLENLGRHLCLGLCADFHQQCLVFVFAIPWYVVFLIKAVFGYSDPYNPNIINIIVDLLQYVFGVIMWIGQFTLSTIFLVSISYLYSHAAEKLDDMSVAKALTISRGWLTATQMTMTSSSNQNH